MKNDMKNRLKEEVERIKNLFTEERLYGNLISEGNPDTNSDGVIDGDEFTASGSDINTDEASAFLKSQDYFIKKGGGVEKNVQNICYEKPNMKKIYDDVKSYNSGSIVKNGKIMSNFSSNGGICFYYVKDMGVVPIGDTEIQRVNFWDDGDGGFYLKLPHNINLSSKEELIKTLPQATALLRTSAESNDLLGRRVIIEYVKFKFIYDFGSGKYSNIDIFGFYKAGYHKAKGLDSMLTDSINAGYEPLSDMDDMSSPKKYKIDDVLSLVTDANGLNMTASGTLDNLLSKI